MTGDEVAALEALCREHPSTLVVCHTCDQPGESVWETEVPAFPSALVDDDFSINLECDGDPKRTTAWLTAVVTKANAVPALLAENAKLRARIARIEAGVLDDVRANHGLPPLPRSTT